MSKIAFQIISVTSHYNNALRFAKELQLRGNSITFLGNENYKELIENRGYNFYLLNESKPQNVNKTLLIYCKALTYFHSKVLNGKYEFIHTYVERLLVNYNLKKSLKDNTLAENILLKLCPDIIIVDSFLVEFAVYYRRFGIKVATLESKISTRKSTNIPPLTSLFIPKQYSKYSIIIVDLLWTRYFLTREFKVLLNKFLYFGLDKYTIIKSFATKFGLYKNQFFEKNKTFFYHIKDIPEIITSPKPLDFPWVENHGSIYFFPKGGNCFQQENYDWKFDTFFKTIDYYKLNELKIIFCSLGSISHVHNRNCEAFFKKVINVANESRNFILVISAGTFAEKLRAHHKLSKYIFLFEYVPQYKLLQECDLMINHGGMQSILECIWSETPMICFPLNSKWDQNGNAARVLYHGIGLIGSLKKDTEIHIKKKIASVLAEIGMYKKNIRDLREEMNQTNLNSMQLQLPFGM